MTQGTEGGSEHSLERKSVTHKGKVPVEKFEDDVESTFLVQTVASR